MIIISLLRLKGITINKKVVIKKKHLQALEIIDNEILFEKKPPSDFTHIPNILNPFSNNIHIAVTKAK